MKRRIWIRMLLTDSEGCLLKASKMSSVSPCIIWCWISIKDGGGQPRVQSVVVGSVKSWWESRVGYPGWILGYTGCSVHPSSIEDCSQFMEVHTGKEDLPVDSGHVLPLPSRDFPSIRIHQPLTKLFLSGPYWAQTMHSVMNCGPECKVHAFK